MKLKKNLTGLFAAALVFAACGEEPASEAPPAVRPVKMLQVGTATEAATARSFPGRVEASSQVDLSFRVGGPLVELNVKEGERVRKGAVLAKIDPRDFNIRLRSARAEAERTEADLARFSALYEKSAVSKAQLDQAQAARDVAQAALEDAEAALKDSALRAPFSAVVGEVFVENFQDVRTKEAILSLVAVDQVKLVVDVPEGIAAQRDPDKVGEIVARFETAPGREFPLTVEEIAAQADPRTQTYRATLMMDQPSDVTILPGMTGTVVHRPPAVETGGTVVVPAIAIFADESGQEHVWVVDTAAMTVERRAVTTGGLAGSDAIEIMDGLAAGETIATSAVTRLRDGMEVRPLDSQG